MDKLKTREKVIVVIAVLGVLYAGYVYLIEPSFNKAKAKDQKQEISATTVTNVQKDVNFIEDISRYEYIVKRAEANWGKNPFIDRNSESYKEWVTIQRAALASSRPEGKIIYSGYIDAGIKKIAILDGLEYQEGDQLEMEGYVLKHVTRYNALILNKNTGIETEIPLSE